MKDENKNVKSDEINIKTRTIKYLILIFLFLFGIMYIQIDFQGNIAALRAEHQDIPSFASDMAFQIKNIACFVIGLAMLAGFIGIFTRKNFGKTAALIGVLGQAVMYIVEFLFFGLAMFNYRPTLGVIAIVLIDILVARYVYKSYPLL